MAAKRIDLAYDALGRFDTIDRYADAGATQLVARTDYTYNNAGRLGRLEHVKGTILADYDWTYDDAGRITQFVSTAGTTDYVYDDTNQLTVADHTYQTDENYSYDDNGNCTNAGYTTGDNNRLTSDGTFTYTYDAEGNRTARFVDEGDGVLGAGDTNITEYEWDHRNRLTTVTDRATDGGPATQSVEYGYDYLNRWVSTTVDLDGDGSADVPESTYFVHAGDQLDGVGQIVLSLDSTGQPTHRYLWGPAVDQILADETVLDPETPGDVLWPLADHLGTVRDLADSTGAVTNHLTYDSFGNITSETNAAVDHLFAFTGRAFDEATGLQNNLNRWYDPKVGRWLNPDPIGFDAGDANLYRYVGNGPIIAVDPDGTITIYVHGVGTSGYKAGYYGFRSKAYKRFATCPGEECGVYRQWSVDFNWAIAGKNGSYVNPIPYASDSICLEKNAEDSWRSYGMSKQQWRAVHKLKKIVADLRKLIASYPALKGETINIVCHSQGTLITLAALQEGMKVDTVIFMGSPMDKEIMGANKPGYNTDILKGAANTRHLFNFWSNEDDIARGKGGIGGFGFPENKIGWKTIDIELKGVSHFGEGGLVTSPGWWSGNWFSIGQNARKVRGPLTQVLFEEYRQWPETAVFELMKIRHDAASYLR